MPYKDPERAKAASRERQRKYREAHKEVCIERTRKWQTANPERVRANDRNAYQRLRSRVLEQYGTKCDRCGITDREVLQVDHINGGGNKEHKELQNCGVYRRALKFPAEYQCLCVMCNWRKKHERNENNPRIDVPQIFVDNRRRRRPKVIVETDNSVLV